VHQSGIEQTETTGQWLTIDPPTGSGQASHRWWFDAGSIALDFAHVGEHGVGGFGDRPEALTTAGRLGEWLDARFSGLDAATDRDLVDAAALQGALARLATATSAGGGAAAEDVDVVNLFAATPDIPPALDGGSRQAGRSRARVGQALSAIAREAVDVFGPDGVDRVRACAADDCDLIFYDESRSNNRRWCSMQRCGNRAKVRAHRERA
jgi:predicted RNA-binding Zn ribbon-like protein